MASKIFNAKYSKLIISLLISFISTFVFFISLTGFPAAVNNLFLDALHGETAARPEIIIVEIDDESLNAIGAWPWSREVFAEVLTNISKSNPSVIGIDVLFLEEREGDEQLQNYFQTTNIPVILGSKFVEDDYFVSIFDNTQNGFVNFEQDPDGKIRKTIVWDNNCDLSFSTQIIASYFGIQDSNSLCQTAISLRGNQYNLTENNELNFSYTKEKFESISINDVLNQNFEEDYFKDKIVLIGSTALDLRTNLNDNFVSIFGDTIPGIEIHANIVNSYLNKTFYHFPSVYAVSALVFITNFILAYIFFKVKRIINATTFYLFFLILNFLVSVFIVNFNYLTFFVQTTLALLVAYLIALLIKYTIQNRESRYIKNVFSRYLNKHLLDILINDTSKLSLGGETKNMTVLFSDIRSFTTISEKMSSEELITMINDYLNFMSDIILKNNGTIDKYIGDAIMAIWNAPLDDSKHTANAITSALEMDKSLKRFKHEFPNYPEINIGIGINTGNMTVGNVGGKDRFDYTVLGDNVNLGSRLEGLTKKYGVTIIVSESTYMEYMNSVSGNVSISEMVSVPEPKADSQTVPETPILFRLLDEVIVKGKEKAIKIYEPIDNNSNNLKIKEEYEKAFGLYQKGKFKEALAILEKLEDKASNKLAERIEGLDEETKKNWDGIWRWEEK